MFTEQAAHHERLVLEARDVEFDWSALPFHYAPDEPFATHMLNVLHVLLPGPLRFVRGIGSYHRPGFHPSQLGGVGAAVDYLAVSPAARASH